MKTFYHPAKLLFCYVLVLFFLGCSSDSDWNQDNSDYSFRKVKVASFDTTVGEVYDSVYKQYRNTYNDSVFSINIVISRVEYITSRTSLAMDLQGSYSPIKQEDIRKIFEQEVSLEYYVNNFLSTEARDIFIPFINNIKNTAMHERYSHIAYFEQTVIADTIFNESDTEIMLIAASVIKNHTDYGDDDWQNQGTTILKAILNGGHENATKALVMAVVVRLIQKHI